MNNLQSKIVDLSEGTFSPTQPLSTIGRKKLPHFMCRSMSPGNFQANTDSALTKNFCAAFSGELPQSVHIQAGQSSVSQVTFRA